MECFRWNGETYTGSSMGKGPGTVENIITKPFKKWGLGLYYGWGETKLSDQKYVTPSGN